MGEAAAGFVAGEAVQVQFEQLWNRDLSAYDIDGPLPDIDPDKDVDIAVTDGELRITAHRQAKSEHKDKNGYRSEFQYGSFSRTLTLPPGASPDAVTATYKDGVLEVRVPVAELPPPEASKIPITRG